MTYRNRFSKNSIRRPKTSIVNSRRSLGFSINGSLVVPDTSIPLMLSVYSGDRLIASPSIADWQDIPIRQPDISTPTNPPNRHQVWVMMDEDGYHKWDTYVGFGGAASGITSISSVCSFDSDGNPTFTIHTGQDGTSTGRLVRFDNANGSTYKTFETGTDKVNNILNYGSNYCEHFIAKYSKDDGYVQWVKRYGYDGAAGNVPWDSTLGYFDHMIYDETNDRFLINACVGRPKSSASNNKFRAGFSEDDEWGFTMVGNNSYTNVGNLCFNSSDGYVDSEPSYYFEGNTGNIFNLQWYGYPTIDIWQDTGDQIHIWYIDNENWYQKRAVDNSILYTHTADAAKGNYFSITQKVTSDGYITWTRDQWGTSSGGSVKEQAWAQAVKTLSDGSCLVSYRLEQAADTFITETSGADYTVVPDSAITGDKIILIRFDSDGDVLWSSTFGCTSGSGEPVTTLIEVDENEEYCYLFTPGIDSNKKRNIRFNCSNTVPAPAGTADLETGANGTGLIAKFDLSNGAAIWAKRGGEDNDFIGMYLRNDEIHLVGASSSNSNADDELIYGSGELPPDYHPSISTTGNILYVTKFQISLDDGSYVPDSKNLILLVDNNGYLGFNFTRILDIYAGSLV